MNQKILWHYEAKDMKDYEGKDMEADIVRLHEDIRQMMASMYPPRNIMDIQ